LNHPFINEIFETGEYEEDSKQNLAATSALMRDVIIHKL
jgi:hypothetical protein